MLFIFLWLIVSQLATKLSYRRRLDKVTKMMILIRTMMRTMTKRPSFHIGAGSRGAKIGTNMMFPVLRTTSWPDANSCIHLNTLKAAGKRRQKWQIHVQGKKAGGECDALGAAAASQR